MGEMKGTPENPYAFKCLARGCGAVFAKAWDYMAHIHAKGIEEWGPLPEEEDENNKDNAEEFAKRHFKKWGVHVEVERPHPSPRQRKRLEDDWEVHHATISERLLGIGDHEERDHIKKVWGVKQKGKVVPDGEWFQVRSGKEPAGAGEKKEKTTPGTGSKE